jgi:hypothetical protein
MAQVAHDGSVAQFSVVEEIQECKTACQQAILTRIYPARIYNAIIQNQSGLG